MKLAGLFILGLLLIIAGIEGDPGSLLGAIIDPANMVDQTSLSSIRQHLTPPTSQGPVLGGLPIG